MIRFPKPNLHGQRVLLRPLIALDAEAMHASLEEPISKRLTGTHGEFTLAQVKAHCAHIEHAHDRLDYGIVAEGELVGEVVLNHLDQPNRSGSFRIAIWTPEKRNRGFGSEAATLLIHHGFEALALNRIELEVYAFNASARRIYEKLGFQLEGVKREALIWDDEPVDAHLMSLLRLDYLANARRHVTFTV